MFKIYENIVVDVNRQYLELSAKERVRRIAFEDVAIWRFMQTLIS